MISIHAIGIWCSEHLGATVFIVYIINWLICTRILRHWLREAESDDYTWDDVIKGFFYSMLWFFWYLAYIIVAIRDYLKERSIKPPKWL